MLGQRRVTLLGVSIFSIFLLSSGILMSSHDAYAQSPQTVTVIEPLPLVDESIIFDEWFVEGSATTPGTTKIDAVADNGEEHDESYISSVINNDLQGFTISDMFGILPNGLMDRLLAADSIDHIKITTIADKTDTGQKATKFSQGLGLGEDIDVKPKGGAELNTGFVVYNQTFTFNPFTGGNPNRGPAWEPANIPLLEVVVAQNTDTKQVRVTQVLAEIQYQMQPPSIEILSSPEEIPWGHTATVSGIAGGFGNGGIITIEWGDGFTTEIDPAESPWSETHQYAMNTVSTTETNTVTATLSVLGETPSDSVDIDVLAHNTSLDAPSIPADVKWGHTFQVSNTLTDEDAVDGGGAADLEGETVTYSGSAVASSDPATSTVTNHDIVSVGAGNTGDNQTVIADYAGSFAYYPSTSPTATITILPHDTSLNTPTLSETQQEWGHTFQVTQNTLTDDDAVGGVPAALEGKTLTYSGSAVESADDGTSTVTAGTPVDITASQDTNIDRTVIADYAGDDDYNPSTSIASEIDILKHDTQIIDLENSYTGATGKPVIATGTLIDTDNGNTGISFMQIDFSGNGSAGLDPAQTGGVVLQNTTNTDGIVVADCPWETCELATGGNVVLLGDGDKITLERAVEHFYLSVTNSTGKTVHAQVNGQAELPYDVVEDTEGTLLTFGPNVSEIIINSVTGGNLDDDPHVAAYRIHATDTEPNILVMDEDLSSLDTGVYQTFPVGGGTFGAETIAQELAADNLCILAEFNGDLGNLYETSEWEVCYSLEENLQGDATELGLGALVNVAADSGVGITSAICGKDVDVDGICKGWENNQMAFKVDGKTYRLVLPDLDDTVPNFMVEIDYMTNHEPNPTSIQMIEDVFADNGVTVTTFVDEEITHVNTINVWTDDDTDATNDFNSIKANYYGNSTLRSSGTGQSTGLATVTAGSDYTLTFSGITIDTPVTSGTTVPEITYPAGVANDLTQGTITIKALIETTDSVSLSVGTPTIPTPGAGLTISGAVTASVLPFANTEHIVSVSIPFKTTGALSSVSLGSIDLDFSTSADPITIGASTNPNSPAVFSTLEKAYSQIVRYVVFGHSMGGSSGTAEFLGNDGAIMLGAGFGSDGLFGGHPRGTMEEQAGTLMHEYGHMLGLLHGGPEKISGAIVADADINCKPDYPSVMSYTRQTPAYMGNFWLLDFSDGLMLALNESALDEAEGFRTNAAESLKHPWVRSDGRVIKTNSTTVGDPAIAVNFLLDGVKPTPGLVSVDINNFGIPGCSVAGTTSYDDHDDWGNLNFLFRDTVSGQFDAATAIFPTTISDLNPTFIELAALQSFELDTPIAVPPPNPDGSTIGNGESTLPIKVPVYLPGTTDPIDYAVLHAEYLVRDTQTGQISGPENALDANDNRIFTYDPVAEFYKLEWVLPMLTNDSEVWLTVFVADDLPPAGLVDIPAAPEECVGEVIEEPTNEAECATFKITVTGSGGGGGPNVDCDAKPNHPHCQE